MLTEFNCQSATCVKNAIVFYYIHVILHTLLTLAMSACGLVLSVFVILKLPYLSCICKFYITL